MAYSYFDYEGTDTTIQTDILCVSTEHMYALKVLSEEKSSITLSDVALAATFTKNNAGVLCELKTAPSTKIRVIRSTPYDVLMHDFSNGAQFNADSVDEVYEQLLYLCQEIVEGKLIIDSSGNFGGTSAVCMSPNELQKQLAAQYSLGYSAGDAAGYARGYSEGENAGYSDGYRDGDKAGYNRGYSEGEAAGKAAGDAAGYARGYSAGEAAGKAACSGGQMTNDIIRDAQGRPIYPLIVTFIEYGKDSSGNANGNNITSQTVVYSYRKDNKNSNHGNRGSLSVPSIKIWGGQDIVGGYIPYTFQGKYNVSVTASWEGTRQ